MKVSYTVDREAQVNYLARYPQALQVQVVPLDERNSIGIADLRVCAQCIADCSPEILGQDIDYTVYAYDFSESDHPLVGQGMLSWILESDASQSKMVVGRVTKNMLAAFNGGLRETLEVKLKLTPSARIMRPDARPTFQHMDGQFDLGMPMPASQSRLGQQSQDCTMTPAGVAEWNAFVRSNLHLDQGPASGGINSPAPAPAPPQSRPDLTHNRTNSFSMSASPSQNNQQQPPPQTQQTQMQQPDPTQQPTAQQQQIEAPNRIAPVPVEPPTDGVNPPSRPSSRASTRSRKRPTGRPRGRPKKKQPSLEAQGSTSGYEEGTDGEEGPVKKKRATTVQASKNINTPFGGGPELLRVAASTSGSIRSMRPAGQTPDPTIQGSHLQEVPRAPTPVPEGGPRQGPGGGRAAAGSSLRRQSTLSQATALQEPGQPAFCDMSFEMSPPSQDGRSPGDSEAATPLYSEGTPAPIGSSPPVPRTTSFIRTSPPASSPILPPMRRPQPDSGFMSGGVDEGLEEPIKPLELPPAAPSLSRKRPRTTAAKVPVRVFTMQLEEVQSQPDGSYRQLLPPRPTATSSNTASSNSRTPAAETTDLGGVLESSKSVETIQTVEPVQTIGQDGTIEAGKAPSPQLEEQAVAKVMNASASSATAPTEQADQTDMESTLNFETNLEEELLAALRVVADAEAEADLSGMATESNSPSTVFDKPDLPPVGQARTIALPTIPASDPIGPLVLPSLPLPSITSFSEAPCPPSEAPEPPKSPKASKNFVKKESIRQKLQKAIQSGEMPPYCHNCGAIETPTWRNIWVQGHEGSPEDLVPEDYEFSEKPGRLTAVIVLERDEDETPTKYQLIKKSLDSDDDIALWHKLLLCNPCGIWICKWKTHRPEERWERDQTRLENGGRRNRKSSGPRVSAPRASKPRRKVQKVEHTSELNLETDPIGPDDQPDRARLPDIDEVKGETRSREASFALEQALRSDFLPPSREHRFRPGSTHSRGSGTICSPIALDDDEETVKMGTTRRLLFPSPRKDGLSKTLDDVSINLVKVPSLLQQQSAESNKENHQSRHVDDDDLEALFRSPMARPSTPPPKDKSANSGAFKTPTRPTPNHRPITRSISRSIRSGRSHRSVEKASFMLQRTPTRTPRSVARLLVPESPSVRRSPRLAHSDAAPETPMTRSLNLLLSEANEFDLDPSTLDLDLSTMADLGDNVHEMIDFGSLLSTDGIMPSSPPKRDPGAFDYVGTASMWGEWSDAGHLDVDMEG